MEIISIKKLRYLYESYKSKQPKYKLQNFLKFNYLNLSIHFGRDEREFDESNFRILLNLTKKQRNGRRSCFQNKQYIDFFSRYLFAFKEYNYLPNKKIFIIIVADLLKFCKQILDIFGIIIIIFISIIYRLLINQSNKKLLFKNQKIYSIYYWNKKKAASASYYYPAIDFSNGDKAFISSFSDSKLFSVGLINSLNNTDFLSPSKILNIKDLFISIFQFLHLFLHDFFYPFRENNFNFLSFWFGWKKASEIFYSILIYNALIELTTKAKKCEFFSWHENQITNRAYSLGVSSVIRRSSSNRLISFNGSLFTQQIKNQFLPINEELEIGLWGQKYYLQDKSSLNEMYSYVIKNNIDIPLEVVPKEMVRTKINLDNTLSKLQISRDITIFTHASYWDLIACILSIFNEKNRNLLPRNLSLNNKIIFIRLHPALSQKKALKEIKQIKEIQHFTNFEFIDNNKESFFTSLSLCNFPFFGESSYVNLAIEKKSSVFAVETNHINKIPIQTELLKSPNLTIISPW